MTDAVSPFPVDAPELIGVGTQAIVDRAKPLGLVWTRRLATVADAVTDPSNATVLFDGDTVNTTATSMLGKLPAGTRVYVDMVPPAANFIIGIASTTFNPLFFGSANRNVVLSAGTTTSSAFNNLPGNPSTTLVKAYASTRVRLDLHAIFFSTLANTGAQFGILLNISDYAVCLRTVNGANTYAQASGSIIVTFPNSGSIPVTGRWLRYVGGGTLTTDANCWFSMTAQEIV